MVFAILICWSAGQKQRLHDDRILTIQCCRTSCVEQFNHKFFLRIRPTFAWCQKPLKHLVFVFILNCHCFTPYAFDNSHTGARFTVALRIKNKI